MQVAAGAHGTNVLDIDLFAIPAEDAVKYLDVVTVDAFLAYVFRALLQRAPDPAGVIHYRKRLARGHDRRAVVADLAASGECTARYGANAGRDAGLDLEAQITQAFLDILGRLPDPEGKATYLRIAKRRGGMARVRRDIMASSEAVARDGGLWRRQQDLVGYAGWPRLARLRPLQQFLRYFRRKNARMARIELLLVCQAMGNVPRIGSLDGVDQGQVVPLETPEQVKVVEEKLAAVDRLGVEPLDADTLAQLKADGFVFRRAVRDTRRLAALKA